MNILYTIYKIVSLIYKIITLIVEAVNAGRYIHSYANAY